MWLVCLMGRCVGVTYGELAGLDAREAVVHIAVIVVAALEVVGEGALHSNTIETRQHEGTAENETPFRNKECRVWDLGNPPSPMTTVGND